MHHGDSSKTNLNHFLTNYELIPNIIRDATCMQTENPVFEMLTTVSVKNTGYVSCMGAPTRIMLRWTSYSV